MQEQNDIPKHTILKLIFPLNIKILDRESEIFKPALKDHLLAEFFYTVGEFFSTESL
jgi:hypothetical protein